jgi:epoxyqueuosine reductase
MLENRLKDKARDLGFNLIGLTPATPSPHLDAYLKWIAQGHHGAMGYLAREDRLARRRDLNLILPGVQSIVMVGLDYAALNIPPKILTDPTRGRISNYAWGVDYHDLMTPRLQELAEWLGGAARVYVDTGAILERSHAQQAGLGFIGKNTMLIHPRRGSYLFLGEILTTQAFDTYDSPHRASMCGSCTRCLNACPTDAFPAPYVLDARRCISYLTIELKTSIPVEMRSMMGNWIYGCDICQEVCPFVRRFTETTCEDDFRPFDIDRAAPSLRDMLRLSAAGFEQLFGGSPIKRIGYDRFIRNVCIAAGNSGDAALRPLLESIATRSDEIPLASEHAGWAIDVVG